MTTPTLPGRLSIGANGMLIGPAVIEHNNPWPCVNGSWGSGAMQGVLMHTMVGNLPGTITVFNKPGYDASAHFGIDQAGKIHQFGPVGKSWVAWHAMAANETWYGIEHADAGNPDNPLTDAQLWASAQVVECLSEFAGFPLQVTDSTTGTGYGTHSMGGANWGGHTCPDLPPQHVRSHQRAEIITRAQAIRTGAPPPPPKFPPWPYAPSDYISRRHHNGYNGGADAVNIHVWQQRMADRGWTINADGMYGPATEHVCKQFQADKGLTVDGILGPQTWDAAWTMPVT